MKDGVTRATEGVVGGGEKEKEGERVRGSERK